VLFNKKFNPHLVPGGDYNVIARGATSLIAKEIRGMQLDQLKATMDDDDRLDVDNRKLLEARFAVRDLEDMLVPPEVAKRRRDEQAQAMEEQRAQQQEMMQAEIRNTLADAFKSITQGQKNAASADAQAVKAALDILEKGLDDGGGEQQGAGAQIGGSAGQKAGNN